MTANELYVYFKATHLCNTTDCAICRREMTGDKEGNCPFEEINKDNVRKYLYEFADKLVKAVDKDYPVDEECLLELLMTDID